MVKNITLSAEDVLIENARTRAAMEKRTLNDLFREWLLKYAGGQKRTDKLESLWIDLDGVRAGKTKFKRDEAYVRD